MQSDAAKKLQPVPVHLRPGGAGPSAPIIQRVRVYAAADFRRQTVEWQSHFRRLVEQVNRLTRAWPGVRFELVELRDWERESSQRSLAALLDELTQLDRADDVDLVIGLVARMPLIPDSIDNLGQARLCSRYMIIRSLDEPAEFEFMRTKFDALTPGEREAILGQRKAHKEQIVFLHEWAHTLGAIHTKRSESIMNPVYDQNRSGFADEDAGIIEISLQHRVQDGAGWPAGARADLRAFVHGAAAAEWEPADRSQLLALLDEPPSPSPRQPPATVARSPAAERPLDATDRVLLAEAVELERARRYDDAWKRADAVDIHHTHDPEVRALMCRLAWRRPPDAARVAIVEAACRGTAELRPQDPRPLLYLADAYSGVHDLGTADSLLTRAQPLADAASDLDGETWRLMAKLYLQLGKRALAEAAAAHAGRAPAR